MFFEGSCFALLAICAQTLGNFALQRGVRKNRLWLMVAISLLAVHFFCWCQALTLAPLSRLVPLTAVSHLLNAALVYWLLRERIPARRWLGTVLIFFGVLLMV